MKSHTILDKPNILFIIADDLGNADVSFNGCKDYETPIYRTIGQFFMTSSMACLSIKYCICSA